MLTHSHMLRRRAAQTISFPQLRGMLECLLRRVLRADEAAAAAARAALSADFADVRRDAHEVVGLPLFVDYDAFADAAEVSPLLGDLFSPASFARVSDPVGTYYFPAELSCGLTSVNRALAVDAPCPCYRFHPLVRLRCSCRETAAVAYRCG